MAQYTTEGGRGDIERAKGCGNGVNLFGGYFGIKEGVREHSTCLLLKWCQRIVGCRDCRLLVAPEDRVCRCWVFTSDEVAKPLANCRCGDINLMVYTTNIVT